MDNLKVPGDEVDEYYEKIGHKAERNSQTLDASDYDSIPKPVK